MAEIEKIIKNKNIYKSDIDSDEEEKQKGKK